MDLPKELAYLWAAACLVALFGIWYTLWSRLGISNPSSGEKRLSKKERAALEEQQRIEAAAQRLVQRMQANQVEEVELDPPPKPTVSQPQSLASAMTKKYKTKGEQQ